MKIGKFLVLYIDINRCEDYNYYQIDKHQYVKRGFYEDSMGVYSVSTTWNALVK